MRRRQQHELDAFNPRLAVKIVDVGLVVAGASVGALGGRGVWGGIVGGALGAVAAYLLYGEEVL